MGGRFLILGSSGYFIIFVSMLSFRGCLLSFSSSVFFFRLSLPFLELKNVGNYVSKSAGDEFLA